MKKKLLFWQLYTIFFAVSIIQLLVIFAITPSRSEIIWKLVYSQCILALILIIISLWFSKKLGNSLDSIKKQLKGLSEGHFDKKIILNNSHSYEVASLVDSVNDLIYRLNKQFKKIERQRNERETAFSSMGEGILSLYTDGNIMHWNSTTFELFNISEPKDVKGMSVKECLLDERILKIAEKVQESDSPLEEELILPNGKILQVRGNKLLTSAEKINGSLLVFNDITRLRQLENHRKQFVANVSHELRTPLTAIQGFIETLIDDQDIEIETRKKFLGIIARHALRLNSIIEDLLFISKMEREDENNEIEFTTFSAMDFLSSALELCSKKAENKQIAIELICLNELNITANRNLLEQALVNLIDNAIKYSPDNTKVLVSILENEDDIEISVVDEGPGIPKEHHARLFERFYSVDKARSRKLGGSGLGLSIVKHIANLHRGNVGIENKQPNGSRLFLYIPR